MKRLTILLCAVVMSLMLESTNFAVDLPQDQPEKIAQIDSDINESSGCCSHHDG